MNKNYERCTHCNRRKWLATGCLRKWLKPMECKHFQQNVDNRREYCSTDIDCVLSSERTSNKFVKFWKNKLFITGSVRSLQRYFGKNNDSEFMCVSPLRYDGRKDSEFNKLSMKRQMAQHTDTHSVLRGHHQHTSPESYEVYCQLSKLGWYWGGISSTEAEKLLAGQHDNVFLVRDSFDSRHILCVSFRCVGRTLHARLRHANGLFSLNNETFVPANKISDHFAAADFDVHCKLFEVPIKLARPLNRFAKLDSLQMICRFAIRQTVPQKSWDKLPLPPNLISYVSLGSDYILP